MTIRVQVLDLGASNLSSVLSALDEIDATYSLVSDSKGFLNMPVVIPGTGDFGFVSDLLSKYGLRDKVITAASHGYGILGICLGAQLLLSSSEESPESNGLGLVDGECKRLIEYQAERVPSLGWRLVHREDMDSEWFYFAHSYEMRPTETDLVSEYYVRSHETVAACIARGNLVGVQYHPEKSGPAGLSRLKSYLDVISH